MNYGLKLKVVKASDDATVRINHLERRAVPGRARFLREAAAITAQSISSRITSGPYSDKLLANRILTRTKAIKVGDEYSIQIAPYEQVGDPNVPAPKGTIKEFLAGAGREWKNVFVDSNGDEYYGYKRKFKPKYAWLYLPHEAKLQLNALRQQGQYGGAQGGKVVPAYWYMQEVGEYSVPHPVAQNFIADGIDDAKMAINSLVLEFVTSP